MDIEASLVGHWILDGDCDDHSGNGNHGQIEGGIAYTAPLPLGGGPGAASYDGRSGRITVPLSETLALGTGDFSLAAWVNSKRITTGVPGDILSQYCPATRRGFNFGIQSAAGVGSSQTNWRNVFFGIDNGKLEPAWTNHGRPGNAVFIKALAVHDGALYAGTYEGGAGETGHVYRFAGGTDWEDCGAPAGCNAVSTLAEFNGDLYAATSCYRAQGSALPNSPNRVPGGSVYRYAGGTEWVDCGQLGDAEDVFGLAVYNGELYGSAMYSAGMFKYAGGKTWLPCGDPGTRVAVLGIFQGGLYASGYDVGGVFRYEGERRWSFSRQCGGFHSALFVCLVPGPAAYRRVAQRVRVPPGRRPAVAGLRPPGRGAGSHGHDGLQRQALWGHTAHGQRLPLRRRGRMGEHRPTRHQRRTCATAAPTPWRSIRAVSSAARCRRATCSRWRPART